MIHQHNSDKIGLAIAFGESSSKDEYYAGPSTSVNNQMETRLQPPSQQNIDSVLEEARDRKCNLEIP
ncbi:hypothetical protein MAM1_0051c03385 [Mucor ambiguus]|uniref:Uncharacterized protein n=1 Tax=Mucor ambiguus TaxID=91626 RepID=A0A0C9M9I5_9FUNG|nr:hypothetical protein MAM1_0051c03385 [Mucor ambiguus]